MTTAASTTQHSWSDDRSDGWADAGAVTTVDEHEVIDLTQLDAVVPGLHEEVERAFAHMPGRYERWCKPVFDRVVAFLILTLVSPVMLVASFLVWSQLGNPVLLRQDRLGRRGRVFGMYKFRTMHEDRRKARVDFEGEDRRRTHKSKDDPRHTPLGRFLRSTSLDELPQLFNVLRGDMSLIGPRPELVTIVDLHYKPWEHARHAVKPGLTGLWQITRRGNGLMHEHIEVDVMYVNRLSLVTDLKIFFSTPISLIRQGRSAAW